MKKWLGAVGAAMALVTVLTIPALAASIITSATFGTESTDKWETDRYNPDEFAVWDDELHITVGRGGGFSARPDDKKDSFYALQGKKLPVKKPTNNTWTAVVEIEVDDSWFASGSNKKRAEFRVDMVDGKGKAISTSPTMALVKDAKGAPYFTYVNPKANNGWGVARTYIDGDKERSDLEITQDWHKLIIKCSKGVITYYMDNKKLGNCTISEKDVYPAYIALGVQNYELQTTVKWDNVYLYNGAYAMRAERSTEKQEDYEEDMELKYEKKRAAWEEKYTKYLYPSDATDEDKNWFTEAQLRRKNDFKDLSDDDFQDRLDALESKLTKDIPDKYWDY